MRLIDAEKLLLHLIDYALAESPDETVYSAIMDCVKIVEEQSTVGRWIPVTERTPEGLETVLVTIKGFGVHYAIYDRITKKWYSAGSEINVIAWMPMPEPYKEKNLWQNYYSAC